MQSRIAISAAVGLAAAGALVAGAGTASATPPPKTCDVTPWTDDVQGRPAGLGPHSKGGVYLWHTRDGFHLRVTHKKGDKRVYSGSVAAPTRILAVARIRKEKRDRVWLSADRKTLYFKFTNHGGIDGVNFRTACATSLTVTAVKAGVKLLPPERIYLGAGRAHPPAVPFTVHRKP